MTTQEAVHIAEKHVRDLQELEEGMGRKPYRLITALKVVIKEAKSKSNETRR